MNIILISLALLTNFKDSSSWQLIFNTTYYGRDYCAIKCGNEEHTMCKYKRRSPWCIDFEVMYTVLSAQQILGWHNMVRKTVAEGLYDVDQGNDSLTAANMRLMVPSRKSWAFDNFDHQVWDKELATIAHRWLSQCFVGHDKCRDTNEQVGQAVVALPESQFHDGSDAVKMFNIFTDELFKISEDLVKSYKENENRVTSEMIQVIWANTYKLGCSEVVFRRDNKKWKVVACNYAPKGNIVGQPIYEIGEPCAACPRDTRCEIHQSFSSLCGRDKDLDEADYELVDLDALTGDACVTLAWALILFGNLLSSPTTIIG